MFNNNKKKELFMDKAKYEVFLINFGYVSGSSKTFDGAVKLAKKIGFQCSIINKIDNSVVGSVCPINGVFNKRR